MWFFKEKMCQFNNYVFLIFFSVTNIFQPYSYPWKTRLQNFVKECIKICLFNLLDFELNLNMQVVSYDTKWELLYFCGIKMLPYTMLYIFKIESDEDRFVAFCHEVIAISIVICLHFWFILLCCRLWHNKLNSNNKGWSVIIKNRIMSLCRDRASLLCGRLLFCVLLWRYCDGIVCGNFCRYVNLIFACRSQLQ